MVAGVSGLLRFSVWVCSLVGRAIRTVLYAPVCIRVCESNVCVALLRLDKDAVAPGTRCFIQ